MRDLKDIKARVKERPYLFEQVKQVSHRKLNDLLYDDWSCITFASNVQRNAKDCAEQTYRNKLRKVGLTEVFVDETGDTSRSDDDTKTSINSVQSESSHIRYEIFPASVFLYCVKLPCPVKLCLAALLESQGLCVVCSLHNSLTLTP